MLPNEQSIVSPSRPDQELLSGPHVRPMLTPEHAWRLLCRRTGGAISLTTFYRWINSGRVAAVRLGFRFLIPLPMLEELIKKCCEGERF